MSTMSSSLSLAELGSPTQAPALRGAVTCTLYCTPLAARAPLDMSATRARVSERTRQGSDLRFHDVDSCQMMLTFILSKAVVARDEVAEGAKIPMRVPTARKLLSYRMVPESPA